MTKHTPTPLPQVCVEKLSNGSIVIREMVAGDKQIFATVYNEGHAAFIVKAVNCHDELVEQVQILLQYVINDRLDAGDSEQEIEDLFIVQETRALITKAKVGA